MHHFSIAVIAFLNANYEFEWIARSSANSRSSIPNYVLSLILLVSESKNIKNRYGDNNDPCGTPLFMGNLCFPSIEVQ